MKLFTTQNAKTVKGEKLGYRTLILYLAPNTEASEAAADKKFNVCPHASPACAKLCLFTAGRGRFPAVREARIRKTLEFMHERPEFLATLRKEIQAAQAYCLKKGMKLCVRLNGTSDINWGPLDIIQRFPEVQFYDYTKDYEKIKTSDLDNYHLTFSRSETNAAECASVLDHGLNVAVVFNSKPFPRFYRFLDGGTDYPVVDGDEHDLRFLNPGPVVIGLAAKGKAKAPDGLASGFVVPVTRQFSSFVPAA